jgi:hypothetical protein
VRNGLITNGDDGMYISGKILGQTVQCLVDTGANVTILNSKVYDSLLDKQKVTLRPTHTNMKLAVVSGFWTVFLKIVGPSTNPTYSFPRFIVLIVAISKITLIIPTLQKF